MGDLLEQQDRILKALREGSYQESQHFKDQVDERKLDKKQVFEVLENEDPVGILKQSDEKYKLWFPWHGEKDLNIVVTASQQRIRLITIWPIGEERRQRP